VHELAIADIKSLAARGFDAVIRDILSIAIDRTAVAVGGIPRGMCFQRVHEEPE
jgi:hypothetical protein